MLRLSLTIALVWLAPGLVAFSMVNILARAFYALGDLKTPMKISVFCLAVNAILSVALVWQFRQAGLAAANTVTSLVNVALLLFALRKKLAKLELNELLKHVPGLVGAALLAGAAAWAVLRPWTTRLGFDTFALQLGQTFLPMLAATVVYFAVSFWLKVPYTRDVLALARRRSST